jgi:hypothetical protein
MRGSSIQKSLNRTAAQEHEIVSCFMHPLPVHERKVGHEFPFNNNLTIFDSWILELFVEAEPTGGYSIYILIRDYPKQLQIRLFQRCGSDGNIFTHTKRKIIIPDLFCLD